MMARKMKDTDSQEEILEPLVQVEPMVNVDYVSSWIIEYQSISAADCIFHSLFDRICTALMSQPTDAKFYDSFLNCGSKR
jgi:hypothetical protein